MVQIVPRPQLPARIGREGFSLLQVATVLYRRRFIILAIAAPLILVGGVNLFGKAGTYTASTSVVVELERVDIPKWNPNSLKVDYNRVLNTYTQSAMSPPVAEAAALAISDSIPVMLKIDKSLIGIEEPGNLADYLLDGLNVSVVGESAILDFQFTSSAPRISLMSVRALRDAFLEFQVHGRKNGRAVEYYREQMVGVRASIDSLLGVRGDTLKKYGYSSFEDELKYDTGQLANVETQLMDATVARRSLEAEYNKLRAYLDGNPREFPMGLDQNRSSTLVYWMNTVAKHDDELNSILSLFTEDSSQARRQRILIEQSVRNLAEEEQNYVRSIGLALASLREKEAALAGLAQSVRQRNTTANTLYRQISLIDSELSALGQLLENLQGKIGEVRMAQFADERVSGTTALSDPSIVSALTGGTTIVYFTALAFLALALGIIVAFVVENFDHRIYSPLDVEENLNLQVFASVSRTD